MSALMRLIHPSPARGYRWFFTFLGIVTGGAIIVGTINAGQMETKDLPILIFPAAIFVAAVWFLYLGLVADDGRVLRVVSVLQRWGR